MEAELRAIAEPHRLKILKLVSNKALSAGEISDNFTVTRTAISQHLRVLVDANLLIEKREGTRRIYSLNPEGFEKVRNFLDDFWEQALSNIKNTAESKSRNLNAKKR